MKLSNSPCTSIYVLSYAQYPRLSCFVSWVYRSCPDTLQRRGPTSPAASLSSEAPPGIVSKNLYRHRFQSHNIQTHCLLLSWEYPCLRQSKINKSNQVDASSRDFNYIYKKSSKTYPSNNISWCRLQKCILIICTTSWHQFNMFKTIGLFVPYSLQCLVKKWDLNKNSVKYWISSTICVKWPMIVVREWKKII